MRVGDRLTKWGWWSKPSWQGRPWGCGHPSWQSRPWGCGQPSWLGRWGQISWRCLWPNLATAQSNQTHCRGEERITEDSFKLSLPVSHQVSTSSHASCIEMSQIPISAQRNQPECATGQLAIELNLPCTHKAGVFIIFTCFNEVGDLYLSNKPALLIAQPQLISQSLLVL